MRSILIIDDNDLFRETLTLILQLSGYDTEGVGGGVEALQRLRKAPVSLVITDILMRGMDGIEVIRRMRAEYAQMPIIAISGGGLIPSEDYLRTAQLVGANITLAKPFTCKALFDAIRELWPDNCQFPPNFLKTEVLDDREFSEAAAR